MYPLSAATIHFMKMRIDIYRVAFDWGETDHQGKNSSVYASSVPAMGPAIVKEIPEVDDFTPIHSCAHRKIVLRLYPLSKWKIALHRKC